MEYFEIPAIIFSIGLTAWLMVIATRVIGVKHAQMQHKMTMQIIKEMHKQNK